MHLMHHLQSNSLGTKMTFK